MKHYLCLFIYLILFYSLFSIEIPYSLVPVKSDANLFENFVRVAPDDKLPETLKTRCWLWYDENALHVAYEAAIDYTFAKGIFYPRDGGYDGDYVRLQLITIPEAYYAYYYIATPTGNLNDGIRNADMNVDMQWNSGYSYTSAYSDTLWTSEMVIPFKDLRFNAKPPYQWKIILTRYNKDKDEFYSKPYANTIAGKDYFLNAADFTLTHQIKRSSDYKFKPYYVISYDFMPQKDNFDVDNLGMDFSFNPGTKTKLKVALNPDFSDIPPDNAQNNYNSKYPPWYMENRFFFTEDLEAFGVDYSTFYTRYIVQPQVAFKFTGNNKSLNYGFLGALDKKIVSDGYTINYDDYYQMASVIKTLPRFKGFLSTASRMNEDYYNHLGIWYGNWEFIKELHIGNSGIFSYKHPRPDDPVDKSDLRGALTSVFFQGDPQNWNFTTKYSNMSEDFRADMGTFYDTGYENYIYDVSWSSDSKDKYLKQWGFFNNGSYQTKLNSERTLLFTGTYLNTWFQFKPKYYISLSGSKNREAYQNKEHDQWTGYFSFSWYNWDSFGGGFDVDKGKNLVYSLNKTYDCDNVSGNIWGNWHQKLDWSLNLTQYNYAYPRTVYFYTNTDTIKVVNDNHYQIGSARLNYNFNNTMTLRNGLSLTSYDADGDYAQISFYSNFRYEFKKDCFVYLGYKTGQGQDEQSRWQDPLGNFKRYSASAYAKVSLTL